MAYRVALLLNFFLIWSSLTAQEPVFTGATTSILPHNPGFSGLEGGQVIRISYTSLFPGSGFGLGSSYAGWSGNFDPLHGGVGVWLGSNDLGDIFGQVTGGVAYSYHFRIARNLFAASGLSVSLINTRVDAGNIIFQDQIDPIYGVIFPGGESFAGLSRIAFNVAAGGVLYNDQFIVSWAVDYLNKPDLTGIGAAGQHLKRTLFGFASYRYSLSFLDAVLIPTLASSFTKGDMFLVQSLSLEFSDLSLNAGFSFGKGRPMGMQGGFGYYSGTLGFSYSYRFDPRLNGNDVIQTSTFHTAGITIRLYNVDKRNNRQTINFPKL